MATLSRSKRAYRKQLDAAILGALSGRPLNVRELATSLAAAGLTWKRSANLYRTLARLVAEGVVVRHEKHDCAPVTFSRAAPAPRAAAPAAAPPVEIEGLVLHVLGRASEPLSDQQVAWRAGVYQPVTLPETKAVLASLVAGGQVVEHDGVRFTAADSRRECDQRWRPRRNPNVQACESE